MAVSDSVCVHACVWHITSPHKSYETTNYIAYNTYWPSRSLLAYFARSCYHRISYGMMVRTGQQLVINHDKHFLAIIDQKGISYNYSS
jgi:hypothetical protein